MTGREHERIPYSVKVDFRTASSFLVAYSVNLSRGGIFLETDQAPPIGAEITLELAIPNARPISLTGVVSWHRDLEDNDGPPGIGVEFANVGDAMASTIDELVSAFQGLNVLLVCTNSEDRTALTRLIRSIIATADVIAAGDARLAESLLDETIDLVVVEADFDAESAFNTIARAKALQPPIPTVALVSNPTMRERARAAGADEVAANPPPFAEFQRILVRALGRPSNVS